MTVLSGIILGAALVILTAGDAHAYLDLGSGSYLLQILLASLLGISYTMRNYIKKFWHRLFGKNKKDEPGEE